MGDTSGYNATIQFDLRGQLGPRWWIRVNEGDREVADEHALMLFGQNLDGDPWYASGINHEDINPYMLSAIRGAGAEFGPWVRWEDEEILRTSLALLWPDITILYVRPDAAPPQESAETPTPPPLT